MTNLVCIFSPHPIFPSKSPLWGLKRGKQSLLMSIIWFHGRYSTPSRFCWFEKGKSKSTCIHPIKILLANASWNPVIWSFWRAAAIPLKCWKSRPWSRLSKGLMPVKTTKHILMELTHANSPCQRTLAARPGTGIHYRLHRYWLDFFCRKIYCSFRKRMGWLLWPKMRTEAGITGWPICRQLWAARNWNGLSSFYLASWIWPPDTTKGFGILLLSNDLGYVRDLSDIKEKGVNDDRRSQPGIQVHSGWTLSFRAGTYYIKKSHPCSKASPTPLKNIIYFCILIKFHVMSVSFFSLSSGKYILIPCRTKSKKGRLHLRS